MPRVFANESELVALLKKKSKVAFDYLYDNYSVVLYGIILKIVNTEEVAEDILQEVFIKIWNKTDSYDATKGRLFTWMLNIARNSAIDHTRSMQHKQSLQNRKIDPSVGIIDKSQNTTSKIDHIGLKNVIDKLAPEYKMLIDLAYFKGYTQDEIAKEFKIPLGTVKTHTRSALNQLRKLLDTNR